MAPIHALLTRAGAISLSLLLAACGAPQQKAESSSNGTKVPMVTTVLPITLFTRADAEECTTVTALIPLSLGSHDFQAKQGDMFSEIFHQFSADYEAFAKRDFPDLKTQSKFLETRGLRAALMAIGTLLEDLDPSFSANQTAAELMKLDVNFGKVAKDLITRGRCPLRGVKAEARIP